MYEDLQGESPSRSPTASPSPGGAREAWLSDDNDDAVLHEPVPLSQEVSVLLSSGRYKGRAVRF